jgi:hypothetical protein
LKYMLFIYPDRSVQLDAEERAGIPAAVGAWVSEMDSRGVRLQGHVLQPASEAATVRVRDGQVLVGNGPFADTDEQISGFNILDCADLDEGARSRVEASGRRVRHAGVAAVGGLVTPPFRGL